MKELSEYGYDLFLSWTGADRELKNSIVRYFEDKYGEDFKIYDSILESLL